MPQYTRTVSLPGYSAQVLYDRVSADIEKFLSKSPVAGSIQIDRDEKNKKVTASSKMFSAELLCKEGELDLKVKLSLLAAPFRSKLDSGIDQWLERKFKT
ncbi:MAG: hypothetical protein CL678_18960 [Bdellovibrionaceae bacterium]|nr:hypothetical protein [Pseudobdellovibrionaceae bacterium]|tara:strand:+ start:188 stop:487 length:300 start_codon:yes stop_codon:yes gene_type:complete